MGGGVFIFEGDVVTLTPEVLGRSDFLANTNITTFVRSVGIFTQVNLNAVGAVMNHQQIQIKVSLRS